MIKNSLLMAYKRKDELNKMIKDNQYQKLLQHKYNYYYIKQMPEQYKKIANAIRQLEEIKGSIDEAFLKPNISRFEYQNYGTSKNLWSYMDFYKEADQLLYSQDYINTDLDPEHYKSSNDLLLQDVVKELNKKFPEEKWKLDYLNLYYIFKDYDTNEYITDSTEETRCIYQEEVEHPLLEAESDLDKLTEPCKEFDKEKKIYVFDDIYDYLSEDEECSGVQNRLFLSFKENCDKWLDIPYTPQEKVMNNTIVEIIDKKCANLEAVKEIHKKLDIVEQNLNEFAEKYELNSSNNDLE